MTATHTKPSPAQLRRIRLELAREHDHPLGSVEDGYDVIAPLHADGSLDSAMWKAHRKECRVVRFRSGEAHRIGHFVRRPGGSWAFRYGDGADEAGRHFEEERFLPGDYVSVRGSLGEHTFKVISVGPV